MGTDRDASGGGGGGEVKVISLLKPEDVRFPLLGRCLDLGPEVGVFDSGGVDCLTGDSEGDSSELISMAEVIPNAPAG